MRRTERLVKNNKKVLFTVEEAKNLTGFSRSQLLTWEEAGIVVPDRHPTIFYTWNQLVFLRVLYYLRQVWTYKQIEKALKEYCPDLELDIEEIHKNIFILFGENTVFLHEEEIGIAFEKVSEQETDMTSKRFHKYLSNEESPIGMHSHRCTKINVPQVIAELKVLAQKLEIENLDSKVG